MNLLKSQSFNHQKQMDLLLMAQKKRVSNFPGLLNFLKKLDQIKTGLNFDEGRTLIAQKPHLIIAQAKIEDYIKILYNFNIHFEIPKNPQDCYQFRWKGRIKSGWFTNPNFYYEIACMYYNYSVMYFNQGIQLMQQNDYKCFKNALSFFRIAMWGFSEIGKCIVKCLNAGTYVAELKNTNIRACYHLTAAYAYKCFFLMKPKFGDDTEEMNSLNKSIFFEFTNAMRYLSQIEGNQFYDIKKLKTMIEAHRSYHLTMISLSKIKELEEKHEEDVAGGFLGPKIGFVRYLKSSYKNIQNALKILKVENTKEIMKKVDEYTSNLKKLEKDNDQVYNNPVPQFEKLPLGSEFAQKITKTDQPHIKKKIQDISDICNGLYSGYYKQLENDINLTINKSKNNLNAVEENIEKERLEVYKQNNIDLILKLASGEEDGNSELENNIQDIIEINGGVDGYTNLLNSLKEYDQNNDKEAKDIKGIIEQDYYRDKEFMAKTGIKVLGIKECSNGLLDNFQKHGVTLTALRKKDKEIFEIALKEMGFLKELESGKAMEDLKKIKVNIKNSENVKSLIKKHQLLNNIFKMYIGPNKKEILDYIASFKLETILHDIFVNDKEVGEVFDELDKNINDKIEEFRNKVEKIKKGFVKIVESAELINQEIPENSQSLKYQQKFFSDIRELNLLYNMMLNNLEQHENLKQGAKSLKQIMSDYLMGKDAQKLEIMKNVHNFKDNQGF